MHKVELSLAELEQRALSIMSSIGLPNVFSTVPSISQTSHLLLRLVTVATTILRYLSIFPTSTITIVAPRRGLRNELRRFHIWHSLCCYLQTPPHTFSVRMQRECKSLL
jgi:hypothetical protein